MGESVPFCQLYENSMDQYLRQNAFWLFFDKRVTLKKIEIKFLQGKVLFIFIIFLSRLQC